MSGATLFNITSIDSLTRGTLFNTMSQSVWSWATLLNTMPIDSLMRGYAVQYYVRGYTIQYHVNRQRDPGPHCSIVCQQTVWPGATLFCFRGRDMIRGHTAQQDANRHQDQALHSSTQLNTKLHRSTAPSGATPLNPTTLYGLTRDYTVQNYVNREYDQGPHRSILRQ